MSIRTIFNKTYIRLNESVDSATALKNENRFFANFTVIILISAAILSSVIGRLFMNVDLAKAVTDGVVLLLFSFAFWLFSKIIKNEKFKMYIFSVLLGAVLLFSVARFFYLMGPAVWTISFLFGVLLLVYSRITMIILFAIANLISSVYMWFSFPSFYNWGNYYFSQSILFVMLFAVFILVFRVAKIRQDKIYNQYEKIYASEEILRSTLLSVGDGIITIGTDCRVKMINPVTEKLTGWTQEEASGKPVELVFKIINEFTREEINNPAELVFETDKVVQLANHTLLISKDGTEHAIEDTAAPIKDRSGNTIGCVLVFRDYSEKREKQKRIEYLSYHDQLTDLYNRRFFEEELKRLDVKRNLPISIVYADVNGLKIINDAFGHENGDKIIQQTADVFRTVCRADDIMARIGGDEFVLVLPKTDSYTAEKLTKRLQEKIEDIRLLDINTSVSFGWDTKNEESQSIKEIFKNAEDFMYQKKILNSSTKRSGIIKSIVKNLYVKSEREEAHSKRVSSICKAIGEAYQLSADEISQLSIAGELHDIGKIAIDENTLNNPNELSREEWTQIKHYPEIGYRLLGATSEFNKIAEYILAHHERWDGTGYPKGIEGDAINWQARVIAIADAYDAMTCYTPYKEALSLQEAITEIKKNAGTQFDPDIARIFVEKVLGAEW